MNAEAHQVAESHDNARLTVVLVGMKQNEQNILQVFMVCSQKVTTYQVSKKNLSQNTEAELTLISLHQEKKI